MSSPAPKFRPERPDLSSSRTPPPPTGNGSAHVADAHSVGALLRQLARDVPDLVVKELALARAEIGENLRHTKAGIVSMAGGGAVLLAGLVVLLMSAVYGLSLVLAPWLSALIVGGVVTLIGIGMVAGGKQKLEPHSLKPDRTLHQLHEDGRAIKGRTP